MTMDTPRSLAEMKASIPGAEPLLHALLGCQWGRQIGTEDDLEPCENQARSITVLYWPEGEEQASYKLCPAHEMRLKSETNAHRMGSDAQ